VHQCVVANGAQAISIGLCQGVWARLAVAVQLQAARAHRAENGRVVHDAHLDAQRARAQLQVGVRGRPGAARR